jgi:hypothetical protein
MRLEGTLKILCSPVGFALVLTALNVFPLATLTGGASPAAPQASSQTPDLVNKHNDLAYDKPIIFFEEDSQILVFYPNGDIIHRGRKLTNDRAVVRALQEILSLSPCKK